MAADVTLRLQAQIGNTQQVITSLEKKVEKLGNKLEIASKKGRKGARSMRADMAKAGAQFVKTALLAGGIGTALFKGVTAAKELRREAERTAIALEKSAKKLQIQAGLTDLQSEKAQQRTAALAQKTGFGVLAIDRINTELVSQGFDKPLQTGASAAFISFLQASNQAEDADLEEFVSAFSKQLLAGGKKKTGKNLLGLALRVRGVFASTPFQAPDLAEFSKSKSVATDLGVSDEDFLSAAVILNAKLGAAQGATGFKNTLLRLAAPETSGVKAFEKLGLDKTDVDLVGETLPEVLKLLNERLAALPEEERVPTLKKIFGQKTLVSALGLLAGQKEGDFDRFAKFQRDRAGFEEGVRVSRRGVGPGLAKGKAELGELQRKEILGGGVTEKEAVQFQRLRFERDMEGAGDAARFFGTILETVLVGPVRAFGQLRNVLPEEAKAEIIRTRGTDFSLKSLESKTNRNVPERVGEFADPAADALKAIDRKREKTRAIESPVQQPGLPTAFNGSGAKLAPDETQQKILKCLGGIEEKLDAGNNQRQEQTGVIKNAKTINRNANR